MALPDGSVQLPNTVSLVQPDGTVSFPDGSTKLADGTIRLVSGEIVPAAAPTVPAGAEALADGSVRLGNGSVVLPSGSVLLPSGSVQSVTGEVSEATLVLPSAMTSGARRHPQSAEQTLTARHRRRAIPWHANSAASVHGRCTRYMASAAH